MEMSVAEATLGTRGKYRSAGLVSDGAARSAAQEDCRRRSSMSTCC